MQFQRTILLSALLIACPGLMVAQEPSAGEPKLTQSEAESLVRDLASQEEALEQSCLHIAAIYHEMAVSAESDSPSVRELKRHYERLAENEERSASAAKKMAIHYGRLASLIHNSPDATKTRNLLSDSAYRR
jgi:translation elongation factor EF-Ts